QTQLGQVRVPFDQGGNWPEQLERTGIEPPHRLRDLRTVIIDEDGVAFYLVGRVAREMDLGDRAFGQRIEVGVRILVEVAAAHINVVDVEQDAAAGTPRQLAKELGLGDGRVPEAQIARWIFHEDAAGEHVLHAGNTRAHRVQGTSVEWQWQQMIEIRTEGD